MGCYFHKMDNGTILHIKGDLGPHCADCSDIQVNLCDYPVGNEKTCDRGVCEQHSHEIAPNLHYCTPHYKSWQEFESSGGVKTELENVVPYKTKRNQP